MVNTGFWPLGSQGVLQVGDLGEILRKIFILYIDLRDFPRGLQGPLLGPIPNDKMVQIFPKKVEFIPNGKKLHILVLFEHLSTMICLFLL